jgi:hypothetical protein
MDSLAVMVKTEKKHIAYVNFIIEGYDGMAVVRTADPEEGLLEILVAPDFEDDFVGLAESLGKELPFRIISGTSTGGVPA